MVYKTLRRRDSNWIDEDNPRKQHERTQSYIDSIQAPSLDELQHEGIVSQMYSCISMFCQDVLHSLENSEEARRMEPMSTPLYRLLDSVYASFITWGNDLGVENGSLDDALRYSQDLRQFTIKIMIRICETIENELHPTMLEILKATHNVEICPIQQLESKLKVIHLIKEEASLHAPSSLQESDESVKSTISDSQSPALFSDSSSLEEALEALRCDVEALIELTPSLEDPVHDTLVTAQEKAAMPQRQVNTEDFKYQVFFDGIRQKFSRCDDDLAMAIAKAVYKTTIRLHEERQAASTRQLLGVANFKPQQAASELYPKDSGYETATRDLSQAENPPIEGSGSLRTGTESYARTLNSYADNNDGTTSTPFPSQPKGLNIGDKFPCVACGRQVAKSQSGSAWRRHLLSDLRPWICCQTSCDCTRTAFESRDEWIKHLQALHEAHPHWNDKQCPFCSRHISAGGRDMIRHVERHLQQISLAALTANPEDGSEETDSEMEFEVVVPRKGGMVHDSNEGDDNEKAIMAKPMQGNTACAGKIAEQRLEDHPLYQTATQEADGLWHCPWEGEGYCEHKPSVLRADHDEFIKFHLESLWCKVEDCPSNDGQPFATQEILYLHELKQHGMHKGGGRFLCASPGCGRSRPGNGFMNRWLQLEHIKNVHDNIPDLDIPGGFS